MIFNHEMKFSKGDHVRIVRLTSPEDEYDLRWIRREGVIIRVASKERLAYRIVFYNGGNPVDIDAVKTAFLLEDEEEIYRLYKEAEVFYEDEIELVS